MYPKQVELNEQNLQKLVTSLKKTHTQIVAEIKGATDFGVANRKQILAQIEKILEESGQDVTKWLEKEMPEYYKTGADHAVKQLDNIGAEVAVSEGFNKVHKETITALIDDSSRAFGESLSGVGRSANMILGKATREILTQEMAKGLTAGEALRTVKNQIVGMIEETGIGALVDKSGKTWQLDTYAEMLFRTKAVEARNRGLVNRVAENDYDLVQVSQHGGACDACEAWEGKILSVTGKTKGYETVADAEADGLFHPNCRHAINVIIPKLASMTKAYDNSQETVVVKEASQPDKAKTFVAYRGEGNTSNPARGFDSYGKGTYYSMDKKYAELFGTVSEREMKLENPLEIKSQEGLTKATQQMVTDGFEDMGAWAKSKGYDSIVDYETEIILKLK